jgi:hypothetical protein
MSGVKEFAEVKMDIHILVLSRVLKELQDIEAAEYSLTVRSIAIERCQDIYSPTLGSESLLQLNNVHGDPTFSRRIGAYEENVVGIHFRSFSRWKVSVEGRRHRGSAGENQQFPRTIILAGLPHRRCGMASPVGTPPKQVLAIMSPSRGIISRGSKNDLGP